MIIMESKVATTQLDHEDKLSANLQKASGIAALINLSAVADDDVLKQELEWASWALMDLLAEAREANEQLGKRVKLIKKVA